MAHENVVPNYGTTSSQSEASSSSSPLITSSKSSVYDEGTNIPPPDEGLAAWMFLFGCFWLEALIWGMPLSFGIFEKFYSSIEPFKSEAGIPAIGSSGFGFAYFLSPLLLVTLTRWPSQRKNVSVIGLILMSAGIFAASFATHTSHLILSQGLLYGIGGALIYNPFLFYVDEWFIKRKGLAFGIFWAGSGIGSALLPFLMEWALHKYGFRITLRAWAVLVFVCLGALIAFTKPRKPLPKKGSTQTLDIKFLKMPLFWAFQIGNIVEGLGYFMAPIWLPTFAADMGLSQATSVTSISLLNLSAMIGMILTGILVDTLHISNVLLISAFTGTATVFLLWGFATTSAALYAFSIFFGITAGGYTATWTGCATEVKKSYEGDLQRKGKLAEDESAVEVALIMGAMASGRGIGCLSSGPISEALIALPPLHGRGVWGTKYAKLIIFVGVTMLLGRFGLFGRFGMRADKAEGKGKGKGKLRLSEEGSANENSGLLNGC